eukprot:scaffold45250_cov27-Phaeocystis_antarctica.AAC.1
MQMQMQISPVQISPVGRHLPGGNQGGVSRQQSAEAVSEGAPSPGRGRRGGALSENEAALAEELKRELKARG